MPTTNPNSQIAASAVRRGAGRGGRGLRAEPHRRDQVDVRRRARVDHPPAGRARGGGPPRSRRRGGDRRPRGLRLGGRGRGSAPARRRPPRPPRRRERPTSSRGFQRREARPGRVAVRLGRRARRGLPARGRAGGGGRPRAGAHRDGVRRPAGRGRRGPRRPAARGAARRAARAGRLARGRPGAQRARRDGAAAGAVGHEGPARPARAPRVRGRGRALPCCGATRRTSPRSSTGGAVSTTASPRSTGTASGCAGDRPRGRLPARGRRAPRGPATGAALRSVRWMLEEYRDLPVRPAGGRRGARSPTSASARRWPRRRRA